MQTVEKIITKYSRRGNKNSWEVIKKAEEVIRTVEKIKQQEGY